MASTYPLATELEPGDRFEVVATDGGISLPDFIQANPSALGILEDPAEQPLSFERDTASTSLLAPDIRLLAAKESYLQQRSHDERLFGDRFAPDR